MLQDRFGKLMLVLIAALLAANLFRSPGSAELIFPLESSAHAQTTLSTTTTQRRLIVKSLQGFSVADLKDVVAVGDGKSFVVSNPKGFMVYTVETQ
ncbi:MAG: hypothetical protein ACR2IE_02945 [Candidatus Sumerlaeaceae bacterium]